MPILLLTPREAQVAALLCRGYTRENIASILGICVNTVIRHTQSVYGKRQVHSRVELLIELLKREYGFQLPELKIGEEIYQ